MTSMWPVLKTKNNQTNKNKQTEKTNLNDNIAICYDIVTMYTHPRLKLGYDNVVLTKRVHDLG